MGRGKKVTLVYGRMTEKTGGAPMNNVWIRLTQGTKTATTVTDVDGNYVFFDSQGCDDGLVRCTPYGTTAWTFASGNNVSSTLEIMGQDPDNPAGAVSYPGVKSNVSIVSGNQTFANLTGGLPTYTFGVTKNSAYNRDWKFGP